MRESYTVETLTDVYLVNVGFSGMTLTDSNGDYITGGFWNIAWFMIHEKIISFQKWDTEGNLLYNYSENMMRRYAR